MIAYYIHLSKIKADKCFCFPQTAILSNETDNEEEFMPERDDDDSLDDTIEDDQTRQATDRITIDDSSVSASLSRSRIF